MTDKLSKPAPGPGALDAPIQIIHHTQIVNVYDHESRGRRTRSREERPMNGQPHAEPTSEAGIRSKKITLDFEEIGPDWARGRLLPDLLQHPQRCHPSFESYVIRSMRAVRKDPRLDDEPRLRELIDVFIRQEAEHTRQHVRTNRKIGMDGIRTVKITDRITRFLQRLTPTYVSVAASGFIEFVGFGSSRATSIARCWTPPACSTRWRSCGSGTSRKSSSTPSSSSRSSTTSTTRTGSRSVACWRATSWPTSSSRR